MNITNLILDWNVGNNILYLNWNIGKDIFYFNNACNKLD
jgi:hypothetical protein